MDQPNSHEPPSKRSGMKRFSVGILAALLLAGLGYPAWLYTVNTISERVSQKIAAQLHEAAKRVEQSQTTTQPTPRSTAARQSPLRQPDFSQIYQRLLREETAKASEGAQADGDSPAGEEPSPALKSSQLSPAQPREQQSLLDLYLRSAGSQTGRAEDPLLQQLLPNGSLGL